MAAQTQASPAASASTSTKAEPPSASTLVLDLGSRRRKQVKRLRKGGGPLMGRVHDAVDQLRVDHQLAEGSDLVIVIVKQKSQRRSLFS